MKKFLVTLAAILCCAMATTVFTSCGDDDDNNKTEQPQDPEQQDPSDESDEIGKIQSAIIEYNVTPYALDVLKSMSVNGKVMVRYMGANGAVLTEELTGEFSKTVAIDRGDNGELNMAMQVYIEEVDLSKMEEVIGTVEFGALIKCPAKLKYEKKEISAVYGDSYYYKTFDRSDEKLMAAAIKTIAHDVEKSYERYGVFSIAKFSKHIDDNIESTTDLWRLKTTD